MELALFHGPIAGAVVVAFDNTSTLMVGNLETKISILGVNGMRILPGG